MTEINITLEELKNFYVNYHGFYNDSIKTIEDFFNRIPSIQYDPLDVIGRNADLVLFSRIKDYKKEMLHTSLYSSHLLIDGWDKQMGIFESKYFNNYKYIRDKQVKMITKHIKGKGLDYIFEYIPFVIDYIKTNGSSASNKIPLPKVENSTWRHSNTSSIVCDYLYNQGILGISNKKGVIREYDLIENIISFNKQDNYICKDINDFYSWFYKRRISNVGALWNKNGTAWLGSELEKTDLRKIILKYLLDNNELIKLNVENIKEPFYINVEDEKYLFKEINNNKAVFIAPLDSFIWDRKLIKTIFDFDYSWEVYVPVDKRKYGYYVLPVMIGNTFVGRFEPVVTRKGETLTIKNWWWENDYIPTLYDIDLIIDEFKRLSIFLETKNINLKEINKKLDILNKK